MKPFKKWVMTSNVVMRFNTAIAAMMELLNANNKFEAKNDNDVAVAREAITTFIDFTCAICTTLEPNLIG